MTITDRVGQQQEVRDMLGGKGKALAYVFFQEQIHPAMLFAELVFEPGAYAGYHCHEGHESILYVVSGKAENVQGGERCILEAGDAILVKSGQAHAIKNIGDEDLRVVEFVAAPADEIGSATELPLPAEVSDWG